MSTIHTETSTQIFLNTFIENLVDIRSSRALRILFSYPHNKFSFPIYLFTSKLPARRATAVASIVGGTFYSRRIFNLHFLEPVSLNNVNFYLLQEIIDKTVYKTVHCILYEWFPQKKDHNKSHLNVVIKFRQLKQTLIKLYKSLINTSRFSYLAATIYILRRIQI